MTTIGIIFTVLGGLILLPFLLHFALIPIVGKYIDKKKKEYKYWNERVYKSDRCQVFLTRSHDLMVAFHHYYDELDYDDERTYAKELVIHFGGFHIFWKFGHNFLDKTKWSEDSKTKYYGLYCIDGKEWSAIWWGKHLYDIPWRRCKPTGTFVWDKNQNILLNKKVLENTDNFPFFKVMENTIYFNKNREAQNVPKITWSVTEINWESPLLRLFGLAKRFKKKIVYLDFDCSNNGDKDFNGIGVIMNDWKGGVYGSSIRIEKNTEPEIWELYKSVVIRKNERGLQRFKNVLEHRITRFMLTDQQY